MSDSTSGSTRRSVGSDNPYESEYGYSRAVRVGEFVFVSGCTAVADGLVQHEGDPYQQAVTAMTTALEAVARLGLAKEDVVRTRMFVSHTRDTEAVGRAHREVFGEIRPAATMVVVSALVDPYMAVEVEVDAYRPAARPEATERAEPAERGSGR
jgi:enamine deaminase RidA (YjgF/YER057c/UK114 family)